MKTKIYYLLLLCLMVLGRGEVWATDYVLSGTTNGAASSYTTTPTKYYFLSESTVLTVSNTYVDKDGNEGKGYGTNNAGKGIYVKYSSGVQYTVAGIPSDQRITSVKFEGFPNNEGSSGGYYISELNGVAYSKDNPSGNSFGGKTSNDIGSVTFSNLSITSGGFTFTPKGIQLDFVITITTIPIAPNITAFTVNRDDIFYRTGISISPDVQIFTEGGSSAVTFTKSAFGNYLRVKLNLGNSDNLDDKFFTGDYFTVTSDNTDVIDVSSAVVDKAATNRVYYSGLQVKAVGTATLTFTYTYGSGSTHTASETFTVTNFPAYATSYPYTWNFSSYDWVSSEFQMLNATTDWTHTLTKSGSDITANEYRLNNKTSLTNSTIDMIKGLSFSVVDAASLCLDVLGKQLWVNGDITVPNLTADNKVTITAASGTVIKVKEGNTKIATLSGASLADGKVSYAYYVTSEALNNGTVTFNVSDGRNFGKHIYSIAVTSPATYATTNVNGVPTFAFTGIGELAGGTKITDVPGIEMTIGASGDTWVVANQTKTGTYYSGLYASGSDREETFFLFEPLVNGFLTLQGTFFGGGNSSGNDNHLYLEEVGNTSNKLMDVNTRIYTEYTCAVPLLAGKTYKLYNGAYASQFHGFSFEPAFLTTDNSAKQTETYTAYPSLSTYPQIVTAATTGVTFVSSNTGVATVASDGDGTPTYVGLGSTTITATVTKDALSRQASYTLEYQQEPLTLNFQNGTEAKTVYWSSASAPTFTNAITSTDASPEVLSSLTITYSSSNAAVATVNPSGVVTFLQSGIPVTITASSAANGQYRASTASYQVTAVGTVTSTITMTNTTASQNVSNNGSVNITYPEHVTVVGTSSAGLTVKYRSENIGIATVNETTGEVTPVSSGTVKIYAYTESKGQYAPVEVSYNLTVEAIGLNVRFLPASGTINVGKTITPYATFPSLYTEDIISITATSSNPAVATVVETLWDRSVSPADYSHLTVSEENSKHKILRLFPTITGVSAGTAVISLTINSGQYANQTPATYTVTVVDGKGLNFDWADNSKLYMYEGDYMMMPAITGNANGYPFVQNNAQRYVWAMTQNNTNVDKVSWYNTNYHPGEGEPFYWLEDNIDDENNKLAYILYAASSQSRTGTHPEGLMIYARKAGTVTIHAKDLQLDKELPSTIELEILPKSIIYGEDGELADEAAEISYPYTWDFTKDFSNETVAALDANSYYWTSDGNGSYRNGLGLQNSDYADDNHDGNNGGGQRLFKALLANHHTIPAFKGMQVQLQGTDYDSKFERIVLKPKAGSGSPHLHITGGPQMFKLPAPGTGIQPDAYRVFIKALPTTEGRGEIKIHVGGTDGEGGTEYNYKNSDGQFNASGIYSAPVTSGQEIVIGAQDADVYWIAVSTEAKSITPAYGATGDNIEMMATYSYQKAMDYNKSSEANKVDAYVASLLDWDNNNRNLQVTLQKSNIEVPTMTGVVLRTQDKASSKVLRFTADNNKKSNSGLTENDVFGDSQNGDFYVGANKNGWTNVETNTVTVDGVSYTRYLNLQGKSETGRRYIRFDVSGPTTLKIACQSKGATTGTLKIYAGTEQNLDTSLPVLTSITAETAAAAKTVEYTGTGETIIIYSDTDVPIVIYGVVMEDKGVTAYMIAHGQNIEAEYYSAPSAPVSNHLLATGNATPTLYSDAGSADGQTPSATSKPPYVPFIFSSRYTYTPTGAQEHDAGYFSFWRIYGTSITAGRNMAYLVLNTNDFGGAVGENGKASDVVQWIAGGASRMGLRFVEEDGYTPTAVKSVETEGVAESVLQGNNNLYDLRGVRVNRPTKGIYIYKGKKVLVK